MAREVRLRGFYKLELLRADCRAIYPCRGAELAAGAASAAGIRPVGIHTTMAGRASTIGLAFSTRRTGHDIRERSEIR